MTAPASQPDLTRHDASPDTSDLTPLISSALREGLRLGHDAFGRLRRELIWTVGEKRTHGILVRFGYSCGQSDARRSADARPRLEGLAVDIEETSHDQTAEELTYQVKDSCEALEHLLFFQSGAAHAQCSLMAGYLTGFVSQKLGRPLYFLETNCVAKKDRICRFVGRNRAGWNGEPAFDARIYDEDNLAFELAETREQLQLTKDRYQNLFENSSSAIFIIDPDTGVCLNGNLAAEELTGYNRDQIGAMTIFDLCHPQEHHKLMGEMKTVVSGGRSGDLEISIVRKDGLLRTIALSNKMLTYGGQRVVQSILRDVTELRISAQKEKDLQRQLLRSERLSSIGRLAAGVAHELKNPLGAIRNAIYYIRNSLRNNPILETDPNLAEILKLAEGEVDGAVLIIGELLDFSRVVQLVPRRTNINEILERLPSIITVPENVNLIWELDLALPSATVDPDRMNQVFCNIANNAVQAMPNGGKLTVRTGFLVEAAGEEGVSQEKVVVSFEDTGVGIEPVHLAKIFEPLFTTKARGTGLGLAITNNIVEKHGGVIVVTSQIGKGTTFTIKLPLNPPNENEENEHEQR